MKKKLTLNKELIATLGVMEQKEVYGGSNNPLCGDISQAAPTVCTNIAGGCVPDSYPCLSKEGTCTCPTGGGAYTCIPNACASEGCGSLDFGCNTSQLFNAC